MAPHKVSLAFDKKTYNIDYEENRFRLGFMHKTMLIKRRKN